ncbi:MAG TPA: hypothetical protein PKE21_15355 [Flavobacteriales bacterium]|nr:hypothetical protein [Flavobacteriales bacterium]HMR28858.1 hypothetical protein [Flavobacteriales bacterium]
MPLASKWKRIVAREFLLLVGIAVVSLLAVGVLWIRNEVIRGRVNDLRREQVDLDETINELHAEWNRAAAKNGPIDRPARGTVADLGKWAKTKYPQDADLSDEERGRRLKAKYPEALGDFTDVPEQSFQHPLQPRPNTPSDRTPPADPVPVRPRRSLKEAVDALSGKPNKVLAEIADAFPVRPTNKPLPSRSDTLLSRMDSLKVEYVKLGSRVLAEQGKVMAPWELGEGALWTAIVLSIIAYPLRFLILGVFWSLRILRSQEGA